MAKISKTWWGNRFIEALEQFMEEGRLKRGRSYRTPSRILAYEITGNKIKATVRGNVNPYFGVYKEPRYKISIQVNTIPTKAWDNVIQGIAQNASWVSKLMLDEMPETIETAFDKHKHYLLPKDYDDLKTKCSCPDYANPCKHIAGVYYKTAAMLDVDPFLLFQLRGLSKDDLHEALQKTNMGQALLAKVNDTPAPNLALDKHFFTAVEPAILDKKATLRDFWAGKPLPKTQTEQPAANVPAILIKKGGDYPVFWQKEGSFVETMESIYTHIRKKTKEAI